MYVRIILLTLMLLLTACDTEQDDSPIDASKWFKGKEGISLEFDIDAPPKQVYEDSPIPVIMILHNKGAIDSPYTKRGEAKIVDPVFENEGFDPQEGKISLSFDDAYVEKKGKWEKEIDNVVPIIITGSNDWMPGGEEQLIPLPLYAKKIFGQLESPEIQVYANICYPYATILQAEVCMDSASQNRDLRKRVCEARDLAFSQGQGAPVAVTRVEVDMIPTGADGYVTRPRFVFHIRNVGKGHVVQAITDENHNKDICTLSDQRKILSTVFAKAFVAGIEMECSPNPFRIVNDEAKFFCTVSSDSLKLNSVIFSRQDNYFTNVNLKLFYTYGRSESAEVEIERLYPEGFDDDFKFNTGENMPWLTNDGKTRCEAKGSEWSCSCSYEECNEKIGLDRCDSTLDICPTSEICCIKHMCEDFTSRDKCANAVRGCSWCNEDDVCVDSCNDCGYDQYADIDNICREITPP